MKLFIIISWIVVAVLTWAFFHSESNNEIRSLKKRVRDAEEAKDLYFGFWQRAMDNYTALANINRRHISEINEQNERLKMKWHRVTPVSYPELNRIFIFNDGKGRRMSIAQGLNTEAIMGEGFIYSYLGDLHRFEIPWTTAYDWQWSYIDNWTNPTTIENQQIEVIREMIKGAQNRDISPIFTYLVDEIQKLKEKK